MNKNNSKKTATELKTFQITINQTFLELIGKEQIWDQLCTQAYAYFQNVNWYLVEGRVENQADHLSFIIKVHGKKGPLKALHDEAKSTWQKSKEKIGVSR